LIISLHLISFCHENPKIFEIKHSYHKIIIIIIIIFVKNLKKKKKNHKRERKKGKEKDKI
jgi:hypothetical protein